MSNLRSARFRRLYRAGSRPWIYYVSFLLSGAMLILLVQTAIYLANWPEDGVGWSASNNQVNWVDPAGPAAGILQPGDIIIRWDGVPIHQSTQTYTGKQPGDEIRFDVLRDGQISTKILRLLAPSAATMVNRLEPPLIALMFWVLGIVVFAFNTSNSMARLFYGIFSYASCGILAFGALSVTGLPWASRLFYSLMWLMGPLVVHLHLNFPSPVTIPYRQFVTRTLYACAAIAVLASLTFDLETIRSSQGFRLAIYLFLAANLLASVAFLVNTYQIHASTAA